MIDIVFSAISDVVTGAGSFIDNVFNKRPNPEELKLQIESLKGSADNLEQIYRKQNEQIAQTLANYQALSFFQVYQKAALKKSIEDELVCQYASLDYMTLLLAAASGTEKMSREDLEFYRLYTKALADGRIDADEIEELRPIMLSRHAREIERMNPCDPNFVLDRIRRF